MEELFDVFIIGEHKFPNVLEQDLEVNTGDLNTVFIEHAGKFAWYATAHELALDHEARLKAELARLYARLDHKVRAEAAAAEVKLSEKKVENSVITHPMYVELQEKYLDASRNSSLLGAAKSAMIHRKDMLVQLGANYRAEGNSDISIKQENYRQQFGKDK